MSQTKPDANVPDTTAPFCTPPKNIGLRGVVVADSTICKVDGANGYLNYRGFDVLTLAENSTFEEVSYLLLHGQLPTPKQQAAFNAEMVAARTLPRSIIDGIKAFPPETATMLVLQAMVPALGSHDIEVDDQSRETAFRQSIALISRFPLIVSAWFRIRQGLDVVESDPTLSHAANFLYTMHGKKPDEKTARDMDLCLILHAEHSFNASTFTGRQIASTRANMYASISGAVGSLSGELHGGANARVFAMLSEIGSPEKAHDYVIDRLDGGGLIMGMGHAVYKTLDPRAKILAPMSKRLGEATGDMSWYEISEKVAQTAKDEFKKRKGIDINANVDFYSASVYHYMGIPVDLFTPIFAISRVSGWAAHVLEEKFADAAPKPALYRPKAEYTGRYCGLEGCEWTPKGNR
jgi:2-methylcitrate synthase